MIAAASALAVVGRGLEQGECGRLRAFQDEFSVNIPAVLAAVVLSTLPLVVLYALARRQLVSGLTAGFNK